MCPVPSSPLLSFGGRFSSGLVWFSFGSVFGLYFGSFLALASMGDMGRLDDGLVVLGGGLGWRSPTPS